MSATLTPLRREHERSLLLERLADADAAAAPTEASRVVAALTRSAWAQAVLRAAASASNLSFAHTRVAVLGSGRLAAELATRTAAMGARVVVVGDDPVALVELAQQGLDVATTESARLGDAVIAFATGELADPVTPGALGGGGPLLLVDAGEQEEPPTVIAPTDPASGRPGIARLMTADREAFLLVAREVADASTRRTGESLRARFALALRDATAADPAAPLHELHARADRALALELLA
ncbi:hypothetical protein SAMN06295885_3210 [Rathayibacter oskolensis]|uniref:Glutamyl-tRNA reductase n=1 Tax=Rathayibacter oskolensis TaxID=1891671 RepID=A0A1X7PCV9_9MICO|nr:hypothetical protein [Rathayibacter oskolensis]SMH49071.1 hypothetical protein SAMN06295885_3210 [Rathayibacter oskolensis]